MNSQGLSSLQALLAFELGTYCAQFRSQFRDHALSSKHEVGNGAPDELRDYSYLEKRLNDIFSRIVSIADTSDEVSAARRVGVLQVEHADALGFLNCFFGETNGLSMDWKPVVKGFTKVLDVAEDLSEEDYDEALEQLENLATDQIPKFVLHAEAFANELPDRQRCFFLLGHRLVDFSRKCHRFQRELNQLGTQQWLYFTDYIKPSIEGFQATMRECALRLPEANIKARADMGLHELELNLIEWHLHVHNCLRNTVDAQLIAESEQELSGRPTPQRELEDDRIAEFARQVTDWIENRLDNSESRFQANFFGLPVRAEQSQPREEVSDVNRFATPKTDEICAHSSNTPTVPVTPEKQTLELASESPVWDKETRNLSYKGKFHKFAAQVGDKVKTLLTVFQEEGWPDRCFNSLPSEKDPKDSLRTLNTTTLPLRFSKDGDYIVWTANPTDESPPKVPPKSS